MAGEEDYEEIVDTLDRGQEHIEELRDQRDELLEANKKLVSLVKKLEVALEQSEGGKIVLDETEYSFDDGWQPTEIVHDQNLELDSVDFDDIDAQVSEVIKSMKRVQEFINK